MSKRRENEFKRIYGLFAALFLLLSGLYIGGILYITGWKATTIWLSLGFVFAISLTASAWVLILQSKVGSVIQAVDEIVEKAISGRDGIVSYDETTLSKLEHKMARFIGMVNAMEKSQKDEQQKIKALISDISHQTKTPLANIILYSQLLEEHIPKDDNARTYVEQIINQSEKLDWLIQSLIKMSRLETGIIKIQTEIGPVLQTIKAAVSQIYAKAEAKKISIEIACQHTPKAKHDPKWTTEALFNILDNAVKYSHPGGKVVISVYDGEMFTRIDVADQGIGIDESELNLVFQRFYRCAKTSKCEGIGIGLYLTREIIAAENGYIKVSSKPSEGSVFSVFLPVS